jgi:hypothetical protein
MEKPANSKQQTATTTIPARVITNSIALLPIVRAEEHSTPAEKRRA